LSDAKFLFRVIFRQKRRAGYIVSGVVGRVRRQALFCLGLMTFGAAILAGCAHPPPPPAKIVVLPPPPPPPTVVRPPRPVPLPEHKPVPPPEPGGPAPEDEAAAATASPPPPNAPILPVPAQSSQLIGLDQAAAIRLFGSAAGKSERPPATVWRWRSGTCELDLYFYLDLRSGKMRSLHYVFKDDATGQQDCLKSLAMAARS
jgi:hypothetical protein